MVVGIMPVLIKSLRGLGVRPVSLSVRVTSVIGPESRLDISKMMRPKALF